MSDSQIVISWRAPVPAPRGYVVYTGDGWPSNAVYCGDQRYWHKRYVFKLRQERKRYHRRWELSLRTHRKCTRNYGGTTDSFSYTVTAVNALGEPLL